MKLTIICPQCCLIVDMDVNRVQRAQRDGRRIYCGRKCAGLGRRDGQTKAERVERKRLYDLGYREAKPRDKAERAAYYQRTKDPVKEAAIRKKNMPRHVEYCRQPKYRAYKSEYDSKRRAKLKYGDFWECFLALLTLETEVQERMSKYEIYLETGRLNKAFNRRKSDENVNRRKFERAALGNPQHDQGE